MDCQAVQARVVERIGLEIRGVTTNFRGLVVALAGEYKLMALKMLAAERIAQGKAQDDATPTHYENRLTADLGEELGLNAADVRRSELDVHAESRFARLRPQEVQAAAARARKLFDMDAFSQALVSELNSFGADSSLNSLPRLFLDWVSKNMTEKHVVFDEDTCSCVEVDRTLVTAVLEMLFLRRVEGLAGEMYRGTLLSNLFEPQPSAESKIVSDKADEHSVVVVVESSAASKCIQYDTGLGAIIAVLASPLCLMKIFGDMFQVLHSLSLSVTIGSRV